MDLALLLLGFLLGEVGFIIGTVICYELVDILDGRRRRYGGMISSSDIAEIRKKLEEHKSVTA